MFFFVHMLSGVPGNFKLWGRGGVITNDTFKLIPKTQKRGFIGQWEGI